MPAGVELIQADVTDSGALAAMPSDLTGVVYAVSAGGYDDEAYRRAYVDGPKRVIEILQARGERPRLVMVSSTGVYGDHGGGWVDETTALEPATFSGRRLLEGETAVRRSGIEASALRFGGIYGPGRLLFAESVRAGTAECVETPPEWINLIHSDDGARAVVHVLGLAAPAPAYLVVDSEPAPRCELLRWIAERIGAPPPRVVASRPRRRGSKRCSNARLLASGFEPSFPTFRDGFAALLDDQRTDPGPKADS
jgi:nucleoside-diphosphate-sugar epimerase